MKFLKYAALLVALCFASQVQAASRFAVCTAACTWDGSSTAMWSASSGGATGASVPGAGDTVTLDAATCVGGVTCTITVNTTVTVSQITMGACTASTTGCILDFSVNNNNVTTPNFSASGTGTRTLKMGNGIWTITGTNNPWTIATTTNLTFNANSSTLVLSGTNTTFASLSFGAGLTYSTINVSAQTSGFGLGISCAGCTIGTLGITSPNFIDFLSAMTITNPLAWNGTSAASGLSFIGGNFTLTVAATSAISWASLNGMKFSGTTVSATNSIDAGGNTNASISGPSGGGGGFIIGG